MSAGGNTLSAMRVFRNCGKSSVRWNEGGGSIVRIVVLMFNFTGVRLGTNIIYERRHIMLSKRILVIGDEQMLFHSIPEFTQNVSAAGGPGEPGIQSQGRKICQDHSQDHHQLRSRLIHGKQSVGETEMVLFDIIRET